MSKRAPKRRLRESRSSLPEAEEAVAGARLSLTPQVQVENTAAALEEEARSQSAAESEEEDLASWGPERTSDWGSLLADLSRSEENTTLRVHDRTHLELLLDYDFRPEVATESFEWEAYFFAPESLRLSQRTYDKQDIYSDLQSYVRFAVPDTNFGDLVLAPLHYVREALATQDNERILRELRLFACLVRSAGVDARRSIMRALDESEDLEGDEAATRRARAVIAAERMISNVGALTRELRGVMADARTRAEPVGTAVLWIDEDVSRLLETLMANLAIGLRERGVAPNVANAAEQAAVSDARYRLATKLDGIGRVKMKSRQLEHLEFRRHVLKRFTSSVLWLEPEVKQASMWVLHALYAVAASVAMAFATAAALWNPGGLNGMAPANNFFQWAMVVIIAYAAKDRIKALLQTLFQNVVSRHFPDRSWRISDATKKHELVTMEEQSGFLPFEELPKEVLEVRRATRVTPLEEEARQETVLYHKKEVEVDCEKVRRIESRYDAITEIYRLDLRRWLAHTDDPRREFVFADPDEGVVATASAPRVYNIGIVYRLRRLNDPAPAPWHRVRVVVNRKGIRRIEKIS
jgi:hypothetical protein